MTNLSKNINFEPFPRVMFLSAYINFFAICYNKIRMIGIITDIKHRKTRNKIHVYERLETKASEPLPLSITTDPSKLNNKLLNKKILKLHKYHNPLMK